MAYDKQKARVYGLMTRAIKRGELVKATACELCGRSAFINKRELTNGRVIVNIDGIIGHHHNGYSDESATDVWWICMPCNTKLAGRHDGSLTKEQAREFIANYEYSETTKYLHKRYGIER